MLEIIPDVLTADQLEGIRGTLGAADFADGRATAGFRAKRVKKNEQLARDSAARDEVEATVRDALRDNSQFRATTHPHVVQRPLISRYREGMEYGLHVDDAIMSGGVRTDVSVTVFLNEPEEYDGGELEMISPFGVQRIKLPAGDAVTYPSSTLHRVCPVTRGERLAAVTWVQSRVREPDRRELLRDLNRVRLALQKANPEADETDLAFRVHANLLRMWSNT